MSINRKFFFDRIRKEPFGGKLSPPQVEGVTAILNEWEATMPAEDDRWLAYMLATAYHETAHTMQPVRETRASTDDKAIAILDTFYISGKLPWVKKVYWHRDGDGKTWLGRGLVQLTHKTNYQRVGNAIGVDLVGDPGVAMQMPVAVKIMFAGMVRGLFTGKALRDYFAGDKANWVGARRVITGPESMEKVAGYAQDFYAAVSYTT